MSNTEGSNDASTLELVPGTKAWQAWQAQANRGHAGGRAPAPAAAGRTRRFSAPIIGVGSRRPTPTTSHSATPAHSDNSDAASESSDNGRYGGGGKVASFSKRAPSFGDLPAGLGDTRRSSGKWVRMVPRGPSPRLSSGSSPRSSFSKNDFSAA